MRPSEHPEMEKLLYRWFLRMRNKNFPVSALMLKEKAKDLHKRLKENEHGFNASDGWLQRFKRRYGVRLLKISGEKLSSQPQLVDPFKIKLKSKIDELGLCNDQLYNADESGLFWKLLPDKTYVSTTDKNAPGVKTEKQRITFLYCANASGTHRLKLLVIGKAKNPRSFKNFTCPTEYKSSKSAWMTSTIFKDWFHQSFVPQVITYLKSKNLPPKALLLIDNAPSHPNEGELIREDGNILAMFMPPNGTPLIQPMDQNAIKITKMFYRNSLLTSIAAEKSDLLDSMKKLKLNNAIIFLDAAWNRVANETLAHCWKNILHIVESREDPEDSVPLSILKENWCAEMKSVMESTIDLLHSMNPQVECTLSTIEKWNQDRFEDDTNENLETEVEPETEDYFEPEIPTKEVDANEAVEAFNKALEWAENECIDQNDMNVLRRKREKALL